MKLEQLFYFKEAVKYHSISVAAEKNFMSQSSISYAINNLEKELDAALLKRTNAGVTPTQIGEMVLQKTEEIFRSVDEIVELTKEMRNAGEVHIASIPCICDWIIPKTLQSLNGNNTEILLSVTTAESSRVAHDVSAGIAKFGILIHYEELERNKDLKYTPLFRDEYVVYAGKHAPFWDQESITFEELVKHPYLAYRDEFRKYNGGLTNLFGTEEQPNIVFRTDSLDAMKSMIAHNHYIACFPRYMSENDDFVRNGWIRRLPVRNKNMEFEVGYVESTKYKMKELDRIVLNNIKETVQDVLL